MTSLIHGDFPDMACICIQVQRRLQDKASFLDGISQQKQGGSIVGGPLAASDSPPFLRLVRTGERWFELQTAGIMCVCSYTPWYAHMAAANGLIYHITYACACTLYANT